MFEISNKQNNLLQIFIIINLIIFILVNILLNNKLFIKENMTDELDYLKNNNFKGIDRKIGTLFSNDDHIKKKNTFIDIIDNNNDKFKIILFNKNKYIVDWIIPKNGPTNNIYNIKIIKINNNLVTLENNWIFKNPFKMTNIFPESYCLNLKPKNNYAIESNNFKELIGKKIDIHFKKDLSDDAKFVQVFDFDNLILDSKNDLFNKNSILSIISPKLKNIKSNSMIDFKKNIIVYFKNIDKGRDNIYKYQLKKFNNCKLIYNKLLNSISNVYSNSQETCERKCLNYNGFKKQILLNRKPAFNFNIIEIPFYDTHNAVDNPNINYIPKNIIIDLSRISKIKIYKSIINNTDQDQLNELSKDKIILNNHIIQVIEDEPILFKNINDIKEKVYFYTNKIKIKNFYEFKKLKYNFSGVRNVTINFYKFNTKILFNNLKDINGINLIEKKIILYKNNNNLNIKEGNIFDGKNRLFNDVHLIKNIKNKINSFDTFNTFKFKIFKFNNNNYIQVKINGNVKLNNNDIIYIHNIGYFINNLIYKKTNLYHKNNFISDDILTFDLVNNRKIVLSCNLLNKRDSITNMFFKNEIINLAEIIKCKRKCIPRPHFPNLTPIIDDNYNILNHLKNKKIKLFTTYQEAINKYSIEGKIYIISSIQKIYKMFDSDNKINILDDTKPINLYSNDIFYFKGTVLNKYTDSKSDNSIHGFLQNLHV